MSVISDGITIDTTGPEVVGEIDTGPMYIDDVSDIGATWQNVFSDLESGKFVPNKTI